MHTNVCSPREPFTGTVVLEAACGISGGLRTPPRRRYAARVRPEFIVRSLLEQAPGESICAACLAFACSTSLSDMSQATAALPAASTAFTWGPAACVGCRRTTNTITYARRVKCAHCSRAIDNDGLAEQIDGDTFHRSCWQMLLSDQRIRISRSLSRRSRQLIAEARKRLDT